MTANIEQLLSKKEAELEQLRSRMDQLRQQFINDTAQFASKWYVDTAKEYVTKYSQVTMSLEKESLAGMKAEVTFLSKNAGNYVRAALSDPATWWHLQPVLHDLAVYEQLGNDRVGNKFPQKIDKPIRRALGELGLILEKYGFNLTTNPAKKSSYPEFWFSYPEGEARTATPYYPHLLVWSEAMQTTLHKYNNVFKQAVELLNEIQRLKDEKKKEEVGSLWESV